MPSPSADRDTTAATPIAIPSIVKQVRVLRFQRLLRIKLSATRSDSSTQNNTRQKQ